MRYRENHQGELTEWSRWHPLAQIHHEINRAFQRVLGEPYQPFTQMPILNLREEEKRYVIEAELPGMDPQEVDIEVHQNTLTIKGEHRQEKKREEQRMHIMERRYGSFHRTITLPENAQMDQITADYENGLLLISIPKDQNKPPRKIQINRRVH